MLEKLKLWHWRYLSPMPSPTTQFEKYVEWCAKGLQDRVIYCTQKYPVLETQRCECCLSENFVEQMVITEDDCFLCRGCANELKPTQPKEDDVKEERYEVKVAGCGLAILKNMSQEHARRIINLMMLLSIEEKEQPTERG